MFLNGMVWVIEINVKRIVEDGGSFLKGNFMFLNIPRRLFLIPLVTHELEYSSWLSSPSPRFEFISARQIIINQVRCGLYSKIGLLNERSFSRMGGLLLG